MSAVAAAEAAVVESGRRLASDLPFEERWGVAREHEANLLRRAEVRTAAGTATYSDRRAIELAQARAREIVGDFAIDAYSLGGAK